MPSIWKEAEVLSNNSTLTRTHQVVGNDQGKCDMQAGDVRLGQILANDLQNVIPLFQRPYVWKREPNWEPLWEDIRLAAEEVEHNALMDSKPNGQDHRTYFLGSIVVQSRPKRPKRLTSVDVVDGQQRLTTLQVLIAAAHSVSTKLGDRVLAGNFASLIQNRSEVVYEESPEDHFKVWPLPQDRDAFIWAVSSDHAHLPPPKSDHLIVQARVWFEHVITEWAHESPDPPARLEYLFETIKNRMQLVQITLDEHDDPQVIFEVLNHRGVPLDAADLIKNLLFQQLERSGRATEAENLLLNEWLPLDRNPWRAEITIGRIKRKRIDILLTYWLTIEKGEEVPVEHLFADFKDWLAKSGQGADAVIRSIRRYADRMQEMRDLPLTNPLAQLLDRMEATQTTTPWPLLLFIYSLSNVPTSQQHIAVRAIDSFIMRRSICRMTTKDYNRLFLQVLSSAKGTDPLIVGSTIEQLLLSQDAESRRWPSDEEFANALMAPNLFNQLVRARLKSLLLGIEFHLRSDKTDPAPYLATSDPNTNIEHLLPQSWQQHWPLEVQKDDIRYESLLTRRTESIHQLGNLTITTSRLNPQLSNKGWNEKRKDIQRYSLLRLTTGSVLASPEGVNWMSDTEWSSKWDEVRIRIRGKYLRDIAVSIWAKPQSKREITL